MQRLRCSYWYFSRMFELHCALTVFKWICWKGNILCAHLKPWFKMCTYEYVTNISSLEAKHSQICNTQMWCGNFNPPVHILYTENGLGTGLDSNQSRCDRDLMVRTLPGELPGHPGWMYFQEKKQHSYFYKPGFSLLNRIIALDF